MFGADFSGCFGCWLLVRSCGPLLILEISMVAYIRLTMLARLPLLSCMP